MDRWQGKIAVVTGASSGIGAEAARRLVQEGLQVVGLARRVKRVEELAKSLTGDKGKLHALKCDVTNQEDVTNAFKWIKENVGTVQILINNAGLFRMGSIIDMDPKDWKTVFDTNVMGVLMCSREVLMNLRDSQLDGHIVHINSVAGHNKLVGSPPSFNVYSASKHAITCINEVMRKEMAHNKLKIKITSLSPGHVKTEIGPASGMKPSAEMLARIASMPFLSVKDIADSLVHIIATPPHVHIQELTIRPTGENYDI